MRRFPGDLLRALRGLPCADLAPDLGLAKSRERGKWSCPLCGSSNGLHCYTAGRGSHCYSCGADLDAIELVRAALGLDFPAGVRWLCERQGWHLDDSPSLTSPSPSPRYAAPVRAPDAPIWAPLWRGFERRAIKDGATPERAAQLATASLAAAVRGLWRDLLDLLPDQPSRLLAIWCERRRLPGDLVSWAGWRACGGGLWGELVRELMRERGEELLAAAGLVRAGEPFPRPPRGCELVLMPYWLGEAFNDAPGDAVDTLRFRLMRPDLTRDLYSLPSPDPDGWTPSHARPAWHSPSAPYLLSAAHKARKLTSPDAPLYLCEGESDCLALWASGAAAAAAPGATAWRAGWASQLALTSPDAPRAVILLTDGDAAGTRFVDTLERDVWAHSPAALDLINPCQPAPCKDVGELHERGLLTDALAQLTSTALRGYHAR